MNFCRVALFIVFVTGGVMNAGPISASLFSPLVPSGVTVTRVDLSAITAPFQGTVTGNGYTITFSGVGANQGVVQATLPTVHATPVAGEIGTTPDFLAGGFGSSLTTNLARSGNYLSTGLGTITITFSTPEMSFALLWGSIDVGNSLTFNDAAGTVITGAQVQNLATGFVSNGFQGPGGSAYVVLNGSTPFTTVTATSQNVSFEFAGVAAASAPFVGTPEPASVVLFGSGMGLVAMCAFRRRWRNQA